MKTDTPGAVPEKTDRNDLTRGTCPVCGADLISNVYYRQGKGYIIYWECENSLSANPTCEYKRIL